MDIAVGDDGGGAGGGAGPMVFEQLAVHILGLLQPSFVVAFPSSQLALEVHTGVVHEPLHRICPDGHGQSCWQEALVSPLSHTASPQTAFTVTEIALEVPEPALLVLTLTVML
jgi:hypothetical protein